MKLSAARRATFERTGEAPTVPPSLSTDPADPEFVFLGYMPIATPKQAAAHFARLAAERPEPESPAELKALSASLDEQEIIGIFINAAGEKWGFKPRNLADRLRAQRLAQGSSSLREADDHSGAGPIETGELDGSLPEAMSPVAGEALIGSDNRVLRSAHNGFNMKAYPWRALGVLVPDGFNTSSVPAVTCSATKIGERYLLTSGHCIVTQGGGAGSLMLRDWWPGADGINLTMNAGDPSPNDFKHIQWYFVHPEFLNDGVGSRDFAILVLFDNKNSCNLGSLGYRVDDDPIGLKTWNFGYPGQNQTCSASPRADSRCGGSIYGMESVISLTLGSYLLYQHDTTRGHSGSAIYDYNGGKRQVLAVHQGAHNQLFNRGVRISDLVFDTIGAVRLVHPSAFCEP